MIFQGVIRKIKTILRIILIDEITVIKKIESIGNVLYSMIPHGNQGIAFKQVAGTGAGWVDPTGNDDPSKDWADETMAYDDNIATRAHNFMDYGIKWYGFLVLTLATPITASKLKVKSSVTRHEVDLEGRKIDIDVYRDGAWIDVDELTDFDTSDYIEASFSEGLVEKVRFRFWCPIEQEASAYIYEAKVFQVATGGGELIIRPEQADPTKLKATVTQALSPIATTPDIHIKVLTVKDTEYSQALTAHVRKVLVMCRDGTPFRLAWATGVGTKYITIKEDGVYYEDGIDVETPILWLQCAEASKVIEILEWT